MTKQLLKYFMTLGLIYSYKKVKSLVNTVYEYENTTLRREKIMGEYNKIHLYLSNQSHLKSNHQYLEAITLGLAIWKFLKGKFVLVATSFKFFHIQQNFLSSKNGNIENQLFIELLSHKHLD